jgi:anti-sigma B factor antagonist
MPRLTGFHVVDEPIDEQTRVIAPEGEIDAFTAPQLGTRLLTLADQGKTDVVVDLSRVTFMDSAGIGVLLDGLRSLGSRRRRLVVVCPTQRILRPFEVTGLSARLPIAGSREEALGRLAPA